MDGSGVNALVLDSHGRRSRVKEDAPTAVLLHGGLSDNLSGYYLTIAPELLRLGMNVILYDRAGHGRSEYRPGCFTLEHSYNELDALLDHVGATSPVDIIGYSLGAGVAAGYVATHPERIRSLVLLEGYPPIPMWRQQFVDFVTAIRRDTGASLDRYKHHVSFSSRALERMRFAAMETTYLEDMLASRLPSLDMLQSINVRTLAIYGDLSDHGGHAGIMASIGSLPNVQIAIVPDASHFILFDGLPSVCRLLRDFYLAASRMEAQA